MAAGGCFRKNVLPDRGNIRMCNTQQKMLALTFDDGPNDTTMVQILALLNRYDARATFFVVGEQITAASAPVMAAAARRGHEIGNHAYSHAHMSRMSRTEILREVSSVQDQVARITGTAPVLFRPPYLDVDARMGEWIEMPFIGGCSNRDWEPACTVQQRLQQALADSRDGAILLMHCFRGNDATVRALALLLPELVRQGYRLVTVSQLFAARGIALEKGRMYHSAGAGACIS